MSELQRPGKVLRLSNFIVDIFRLPDDAFHILEVFNILDIDGLSTLFCLINPMVFALLGMKLFLLDVLADLASNSILPLRDFVRLSYCNSSDVFLDEYPSDEVSSNESYSSLALFMRSDCIS